MPAYYKGVFLEHFTEREVLNDFPCSYTGLKGLDPYFMQKIDQLREESGVPVTITSGYRSPEHPIEAAKATPGPHSTGQAVDIRCVTSSHRQKLVDTAVKLGFKRIGIHDTFVHLDRTDGPDALWLY